MRLASLLNPPVWGPSRRGDLAKMLISCRGKAPGVEYTATLKTHVFVVGIPPTKGSTPAWKIAWHPDESFGIWRNITDQNVFRDAHVAAGPPLPAASRQTKHFSRRHLEKKCMKWLNAVRSSSADTDSLCGYPAIMSLSQNWSRFIKARCKMCQKESLHSMEAQYAQKWSSYKLKHNNRLKLCKTTSCFRLRVDQK